MLIRNSHFVETSLLLSNFNQFSLFVLPDSEIGLEKQRSFTFSSPKEERNKQSNIIEWKPDFLKANFLLNQNALSKNFAQKQMLKMA